MLHMSRGFMTRPWIVRSMIYWYLCFHGVIEITDLPVEFLSVDGGRETHE